MKAPMIGLLVIAFLFLIETMLDSYRIVKRSKNRTREAEPKSFEEVMREVDQELLEEANKVRERLGLPLANRLAKERFKEAMFEMASAAEEIKEYVRVKSKPRKLLMVQDRMVYDPLTGQQLYTVGDILDAMY